MSTVEAKDADYVEGTNVEEVQDKMDALILSMFEAMRNASGAKEDVQPFVEKMKAEFAELKNGIDNLKGINRTKEDQYKEMQELSAEFEVVKAGILKSEKHLLELKAEIDCKLEQELSIS